MTNEDKPKPETLYDKMERLRKEYMVAQTAVSDALEALNKAEDEYYNSEEE